jgi:putative ABC transport system ATP-binding protein
MISTKNLRFSYSKDQEFIFPDLYCEAGSTLLITGDSGRGKTTYLHLLAGLLQPKSGEIIIEFHYQKRKQIDIAEKISE